jgi:hypothetical protein
MMVLKILFLQQTLLPFQLHKLSSCNIRALSDALYESGAYYEIGRNNTWLQIRDDKDHIMALSEIGKTPVVVNDYPGFVANRILMPMINEAIETLYNKVAGVYEIDTVMELVYTNWAPLHNDFSLTFSY